jgi:pimeloyl-ACP methyl ester carboxylesterase
MKATVDDVSNFVDEFSADRPVIVGWSLGGLVASKVAINFPGSRLILVGVRSQPSGENESEMMKRRILSDFPRFARGMIRSFTSSMVSQDTEEWLFDMAIRTPIDVHVASLANVS